MNIVGLGKAGCAVASSFGVYPQYSVYKIDDEVSGDNSFSLGRKAHPEEYEKEAPDLKEFFKDIEGEVTFILCGAGKVAGASLAILQQLKHCKITVLYIKPNLDSLEDMQLKMHRVCFGVLQEYARSALLERIYLVDNAVIENILDNLPIIGYFEKVNEPIVWIMHMINVLKNTEPVMGKLAKSKETHRISTFGTVDFLGDKPQNLFLLDSVREASYLFLVKEEDLKSNNGLLKKITDQVNSLRFEECRSSYAIYPSQYEENYVFCLLHTPYIQKE